MSSQNCVNVFLGIRNISIICLWFECVIYPKIINIKIVRIINTHVFRNVVQEFVVFNLVKENVLTLTGSDFSESLLRDKRYGQS